ncbi:tetratricopeptide repeat protein, partial [bacterium]|nr:tetratricopeptide repeat protein [bacterium]
EYNAGKYLEAIILWEKALRLTPQHQKIKNICLEAYLAQGIIYYRENKLKEAEKIWKKALIIQPGHKKAAKYLKRAETKIKTLKELE